MTSGIIDISATDIKIARTIKWCLPQPSPLTPMCLCTIRLREFIGNYLFHQL
jgi:hypothetical protein